MRVIVVFPGALGDLCLLMPSLAATMAHGDVVALSVRRVLAPLVAELLPAVELGPPVDGAAMATIFAGDVAGDVREWLRGADRVHAWLGLGDVGGRLASLCRQGPSLHAVPRGEVGPHASEEYAAALGVRPAARGWIDEPTRSVDAVPWRVPPSARLLVHPGAGSPAKRWSADGFRDVADAWVAAGGEAAIVLGPAEEDELTRWRTGVHPVIAELALAEAPATIAAAASWVGNDAGMTHLAGLLRRRGVALFGPTRPERWRPRGGTLEVVSFAGRPIPAVTRDVVRSLGAPFGAESA